MAAPHGGTAHRGVQALGGTARRATDRLGEPLREQFERGPPRVRRRRGGLPGALRPAPGTIGVLHHVKGLGAVVCEKGEVERCQLALHLARERLGDARGHHCRRHRASTGRGGGAARGREGLAQRGGQGGVQYAAPPRDPRRPPVPLPRGHGIKKLLVTDEK